MHHAVGDMDHPSIFSSDHALDNHVALEQVRPVQRSLLFQGGYSYTGIAEDRTLRFGSGLPSIEHSARTLERSAGLILWRMMNSDDSQYTKPPQRQGGVSLSVSQGQPTFFRFTAT